MLDRPAGLPASLRPTGSSALPRRVGGVAFFRFDRRGSGADNTSGSRRFTAGGPAVRPGPASGGTIRGRSHGPPWAIDPPWERGIEGSIATQNSYTGGLGSRIDTDNLPIFYCTIDQSCKSPERRYHPRRRPGLGRPERPRQHQPEHAEHRLAGARRGALRPLLRLPRLLADTG